VTWKVRAGKNKRWEWELAGGRGVGGGGGEVEARRVEGGRGVRLLPRRADERYARPRPALLLPWHLPRGGRGGWPFGFSDGICCAQATVSCDVEPRQAGRGRLQVQSKNLNKKKRKLHFPCNNKLILSHANRPASYKPALDKNRAFSVFTTLVFSLITFLFPPSLPWFFHSLPRTLVLHLQPPFH
jgi:hypothetical protein